MVAHSSLLLFKLGLSKLSVRSLLRFATSDTKVLFVVEIKQSMFMQLSVVNDNRDANNGKLK